MEQQLHHDYRMELPMLDKAEEVNNAGPKIGH